MQKTLCKLLLTAVLGAAPMSAGALTPPAALAGEAPLLHLAQSRAEVRRDRRAVREERRDLRRAQRSGDARRVRGERRDLREAQRDLRGARRAFRDERDFRRRYYVRNGRRYYRAPTGAEVFAGFVAGAIAGAASSAAARNADAIAYCESRYRSYDRASGTYLGYDGRRHPCP
jgi:hypothetical protein